MIESVITSRGRTTLPGEVREALSIKAGDRVRYFIHGDEVHIRKVKPISRLFGVLENEGPSVSLDDMERAIIEGTTNH